MTARTTVARITTNELQNSDRILLPK